MTSEREQDDLRRMATARLDSVDDAGAVSSGDPNAVIQELRVHQIELELQYDTLIETQKELRAAQRMYFDLYHYAPAGYLTLDRQGIIHDLNIAASKLFRRERRRLLHRPFAVLLDGKSHQIFFEHLAEAFANDFASCELDLHVSMTESLNVLVETSAGGAFHDDLCRMMLVDITARRQTETALAQSEERYRQIVETAQEGIWLLDPAGKSTFVNERMADMLGYRPVEMMGKSFLDFMDESERMTAARNLERRRQGVREQHEFRFRRKDGSELWTSLSTNPIYDQHGVMIAALGMLTDITGRKATEHMLRASAKRYRQMFESHTLPKLIIDPTTGHILDANKAAETCYGHALATLRQMNFLDFGIAEQDGTKQMLVNAEDVLKEVYVVRQKTAKGARVMELYPTRLDLDHEQVLLLSVVDVTDKHAAQNALEEANRLLQQGVLERTLELDAAKRRMEAVFASSANAVVVLDNAHTILQANLAFERLFALADIDYVECPLEHFVHTDDRDRLRDAVARVSALGAVVRLEIRTAHEGDVRDMDVGLAPLTGVGEGAIVASMRDITDHNATMRALADSEARYRVLADSVNDIIARLAPTGAINYITPSAEVITGYRIDELVGKLVYDFIHDDDKRAVEILGEDALATGHAPYVLFRLQHADGHYLWMESSARAIYAADGGPLREYITVTRNVTRRVEAEAQTRALSQRLEMATQAVGAGIWDWNLEENTIYWDERMHQLYGLPPGTYDGRIETWWAFFHPDDLEKGKLELERTVDHDEPLDMQFRIIMPNGEVRHIRSTAMLIRDANKSPLRMVGLNLDMTEYRRAADALAEERNLLRTLIDTIPDLIFVKDMDHRFVLANAAVLKIMGIDDPAAIVGKSDHDLAPAEYAQRFRANEVELFATGKPLIDYETSFTARDGKPRWTVTTEVPLRNLNGKLTGLVGIAHDITELKRQEAALRESEQRLELAARAGNIGIWDHDIVNDVLIWDDVMLKLYGLTREEFRGVRSHWTSLVHPDDLPRLVEIRNAALRDGSPFTYEFRIVRPDGAMRHLRANAMTFLTDDGQPARMIGVNVDITERMRAQAALEQALEQERELGELKSRFVSMASHEFRTPLAGILATAESLARYRTRMDSAQIDERLSKIRDRVIYMRDILEDVLVLARIQSGRIDFQPANVDVSAMCREILREIDSRLDAHGRIHFQVSPDNIVAFVDERLIRQAIDNVVANAVKYSAADTSVSVVLEQTDAGLRLTVRDAGIGIPDDDLRYLFEPFHRARNAGTIPGTGLGLSIAKQAVDIHGGAIEVESTEGVGTEIVITLPRRSSTPAHMFPWVDVDVNDV